MVINGATLTVAQIVTQLQADLAIITAAEDARQQMHDAGVAETQMRVALQNVGNGIRGYVANAFGTSSTQYSALGFQRKSATPLTAEAQLLKVEKLRATRTARGTKGKKQRAAIHGVVPEPTPPAPEPTPAAPQVVSPNAKSVKTE